MEQIDIIDTEEIAIVQPQNKYPSVLERMKATFIDTVVIILLMFVFSFLFSFFDVESENLRMIIFVVVFALYDPILISLFGRTIGHKINCIALRRQSNEKRKISFIPALIRYAFKVFLGWFSLLTVGSNSKRKAIQVMVVGSVVVYDYSK